MEMWDNFIKLAEAFGEDKGYEKSIQILKNLEDLEVAILIVFLLTVILIYQIFQCYKKKKKSSEEQNKDKEEKKSSLLKYFDTCTQKLEGKAKDNLKIKKQDKKYTKGNFYHETTDEKIEGWRIYRELIEKDKKIEKHLARLQDVAKDFQEYRKDNFFKKPEAVEDKDIDALKKRIRELKSKLNGNDQDQNYDDGQVTQVDNS